MQLRAVPILIVAVALHGCTPKDKSDEKATKADTPAADGSTDTATDGTKDDESKDDSDGDGKKTVDPKKVSVAGTVNLDTAEGSVLAYGIDGSIASGKVAPDGKFDIALNKENSYSVVLVPGTVGVSTEFNLAAGDPIEAVRVNLAELGLDNIPTQVAGGNIDLGNLGTPTGGVASPDASTFDQTKFLSSIGTTESEARFAGSNDDATSLLSNVDADGNGVLDFQENKRIKIGVSYSWGRNTNSGSLDAIKGEFTDLTHVIKDDNYNFTSFTFYVQHSSSLPASATLTFPAMQVCGPGNVCSNATSLAVSPNNGNPVQATDVIPAGAGQPGFPAAQFSFMLEQRNDGARNLLVAGDYGLNLGTFGNFNFKDLRPRIITNEKGAAFIEAKFNVDSNDLITGIEYQWRVNDLTTGLYRDATVTELALLFKGAVYSQGGIVCKDNGPNNGTDIIDCAFPFSSIKGSVDNSANCPQAATKFTGKHFADLKSCMISTRDAYGTQMSYQLFK